MSLLLQRIVANLVGGIQRFLEVAGFENALLFGKLAPDASITIRLKLNTHGHLLASTWLMDWRRRLNSGRTPVRFWMWWPTSCAIT